MTKAEQETQAELRASDRANQAPIEPDHEPVPTVGRLLTIEQALTAAKRRVGFVAKDGKLTEGARYEYRGIEHVLNKVGPAFAEVGVTAIPKLLTWERDTYTTKNGSVQHWHLVTVEYRFVANDGSEVTATTPGEGADGADKGVSKAMAVAYRTALVQVLSLPTKDEDGESTRAEAAPAPAPTDMRSVNKARQYLEAAKAAQTVAMVAQLWDEVAKDGLLQVAIADGEHAQSTTLADRLTEIGTRLQGQVSP